MKNLPIMRQELSPDSSLSPEQREAYARDGYLFFPGLLSPDMVASITAGVPDAIAAFPQGVIREADGENVRSHFAGHLVNASLAAIANSPLITTPASQLLDDAIYVHQFKLNFKTAFSSDVWAWHQDCPAWLHDDGMPAPRALTAMVFLTELTELNGPLFIIPGSQRGGTYEDGFAQKGHTPGGDWRANLVAKMKYPMTRETVARLLEGGVTSVHGPKGSVLLFDCNLVHASPSNMSPEQRSGLFISYNALSNRLRDVDNPRPSHIADRSFVRVGI